MNLAIVCVAGGIYRVDLLVLFRGVRVKLSCRSLSAAEKSRIPNPLVTQVQLRNKDTFLDLSNLVGEENKKEGSVLHLANRT